MRARIPRAMYGVLTLCAGAWAGMAVAATAYGPICDTAAKVVCPSGSFVALEISNNTCGTWNHRAMLDGSYAYRYYGGCANACAGTSCNGGAGNYYVVTGASGWDFRQLHFNANTSSGSKTCDSCSLGLVGGTGQTTFAHSHSDNRQYGTRKTSWASVSSCGSSGYCGHIVGYPTL